MIKIKNYTDRAEIYIYGVIIDDTDAQLMFDENHEVIGYVFPAKIKEELDELKGKPVDVHIASDGGDVAAGVALFNMLVSHEAPVTVYIDSWAASIASVIAFAGNKIVMPENTFLMIHNPRGGAYGEADYLHSVADYLTKIKEMIVNTYAANMENGATYENKKFISDYMDKESWLSAKEAAAMFKKVELVESNDMEAVAQYKTAYKTAPKSLLERAETLAKNKIIKVLTEAYENEEKG